jgi:pyruvate/2-oxoglutarate dehydrogenase complex dihydrolipoamide acyltransferase (E2) component
VSSSTTEATNLVDVVMPQMGVSVSEGTIVAWRATVGDTIAYEAPIVDISTDKIDTEVPAPAAGVVAEVLVEEGTTVSVGTLLARIAVGGGAAGGENDEVGEASEAAAAQGETPAPATDSPAPAPAVAMQGQVRRYSPVVQRIAAEHGLDLDGVEGTGRGGRVTKKDVMRAVEASAEGGGADDPPLHIESPYRPDPEPPRAAAAPPPAAPAPAPALSDLGGVSEPLSRMRQSIGRATNGR